MWERKVGYCENCLYYQPKIKNCINCYVEKLTERSREFVANGNKVNSREAMRLASYLQQLSVSFDDATKM